MTVQTIEQSCMHVTTKNVKFISRFIYSEIVVNFHQQCSLNFSKPWLAWERISYWGIHWNVNNQNTSSRLLCEWVLQIKLNGI